MTGTLGTCWLPGLVVDHQRGVPLVYITPWDRDCLHPSSFLQPYFYAENMYIGSDPRAGHHSIDVVYYLCIIVQPNCYIVKRMRESVNGW